MLSQVYFIYCLYENNALFTFDVNVVTMKKFQTCRKSVRIDSNQVQQNYLNQNLQNFKFKLQFFKSIHVTFYCVYILYYVDIRTHQNLQMSILGHFINLKKTIFEQILSINDFNMHVTLTTIRLWFSMFIFNLTKSHL